MDSCLICGGLLTVSTPEWSENGAIEVRCLDCGDSWIVDSWSNESALSPESELFHAAMFEEHLDDAD